MRNLTNKRDNSKRRNQGGYQLDNILRDSDYRMIPNNFKNKLGVAFATT